ncbi:phosphatase PAP2 family protein [Streptomyces tubercidicus]|uniref:phosphatase PAP2 family protein n=1 Tax=Streptomyces tubercidicus TaxID=47759 RepID=UPI0030DEC222
MRDTGQRGRLGTTPPVPRRPTPIPGSPGPSGDGSRRFSPWWICAVGALLFAALTWQVADHGPLRTLDERLGRALASGELPAGPAEFAADLGNTAVALPVLCVVMVWAGWQGWRGSSVAAPGDVAPVRWWLPPLAAGLTLAAVPALVVPLKLWLARPGPPQMAGGAHDGFYPSGHGATAAVAYGVAGLLVIRAVRGTRAGRPGGRPVAPVVHLVTPAVVAAVALLNGAVGLGLVRRGYHWPLDVLGSWCLAGVLLGVWCVVCDRWSGAGAGRAGRAPTPDHRTGS